MLPSNWPIVISGKHVSGRQRKIKKAERLGSALEIVLSPLIDRATTNREVTTHSLFLRRRCECLSQLH